MTKAERMFNANRRECEKHIEYWGYQTMNGKAVGFNTVMTSDSDTYCKWTLNEIMKLVKAYRRNQARALKYGVIDQQKYEFKMQVMNMVESTVENSRKVLASIK